MNEERATGVRWAVAFLVSIPLCALLGGGLGYALFGANVAESANAAAHAVDDASVAYPAQLVGGVSALVWNSLVTLGSALFGALSGLVVAPAAVWLSRRMGRNARSEASAQDDR